MGSQHMVAQNRKPGANPSVDSTISSIENHRHGSSGESKLHTQRQYREQLIANMIKTAGDLHTVV